MSNVAPNSKGTALVTGASDGIGRATAKALGKLGYDLLLVARREAALRQLADELPLQAGRVVDVLPADLSTGQGLALVRDAISGRDVSVAVLAAGYGLAGELISSDIADELAMVDVNCRSVLALSHDLAQSMVRRGSGQLVLFGSIVAFQGSGGIANYAATKAYVQTLAEGLRMELAPKGVQVLSVAPGPVNTGFAARAGMKMGAAATPEEVAAAIITALGRSGTIRPGFLAKLLGYNMALTPRPLRTRLMTRIQAGMLDRSRKAPGL